MLLKIKVSKKILQKDNVQLKYHLKYFNYILKDVFTIWTHFVLVANGVKKGVKVQKRL